MRKTRFIALLLLIFLLLPPISGCKGKNTTASAPPSEPTAAPTAPSSGETQTGSSAVTPTPTETPQTPTETPTATPTVTPTPTETPADEELTLEIKGKTLTARLNLPSENGNEAALLLLTDRAFAENWADHPGEVLGIDQVTLSKSGTATVTMLLQSEGQKAVLFVRCGSTVLERSVN